MAFTRPICLVVLGSALTAILPLSAVYPAQTTSAKDERKAAAHGVKSASIDALWRDPGDIASLDLATGAGGKAHAPRPGAEYSFVEEDLGGTSTKFYLKDQDGVEWLAKVGPEARGETVASRLVWAMGYYTDEEYFVARIHVTGMTRMRRHSKSIQKDGTITDVRLKRSRKGEKKLSTWAWEDNPFVGTRELNGLRVMMALVNNWDLKTVNNKIYGLKDKEKETDRDEDRAASPEPSAAEQDRPWGSSDDAKADSTKADDVEADHDKANDARQADHHPHDFNGEKVRYVVSDLGASFGRTGGVFSRSKGKIHDYKKDDFIQSTNPDTVDFVMRTEPGVLIRPLRPNYTRQREAMAGTVQNVPRADAKWIGSQLAKLTPQQIRAAFQAAGFNAKEVEGYVAEITERIGDLNAL